MMTPDEARAVLDTSTTKWTSSTFSDQQNCVQIGVNANAAGFVGVRDSKLGPASPVFVLSYASFRGLLSSVASKGPTPTE